MFAGNIVLFLIFSSSFFVCLVHRYTALIKPKASNLAKVVLTKKAKGARRTKAAKKVKGGLATSTRTGSRKSTTISLATPKFRASVTPAARKAGNLAKAAKVAKAESIVGTVGISPVQTEASIHCWRTSFHISIVNQMHPRVCDLRIRVLNNKGVVRMDCKQKDCIAMTGAQHTDSVGFIFADMISAHNIVSAFYPCVCVCV